MTRFSRPVQPVRIMETCAGCHRPIETFWMSDGSGLVGKPEYVLLGDWIYHAHCVPDFEVKLPPLPPRKELP